MKFPAPWAWFLLSVRRRFSTTRDLIVPVAFATLVLSAVATPVVALSGLVRSQESSETALTQIEVTPAQAADEVTSGLTQPVLDEIAETPGVVNVIPDVSVGIYAADGGTWALSLRPLNPASLPPDVETDISGQVVDDRIIVPATVDEAELSDQVGSDVAVSYTRMTGENTGELAERRVRFVAAYDPSWQGYGPGAAFASQELVVELLAAKSGLGAADYMKTVGLTAITVTAATTQDVDAVTAHLRELGLTAIPVGDTLGQLPGVFSIFPQILLVAAIGSALLLLLQLNRAVRGSLARRTNEFGLLRLRAWSARDVSRLITLDVSTGSLLGALVGAVLGAGIGYALVLGLVPAATGATFGPVAVAMPVLALVVAIFCAVVSLVASRRTLETDPFITVMSRRR